MCSGDDRKHPTATFYWNEVHHGLSICVILLQHTYT